jgi:hypothetical protein
VTPDNDNCLDCGRVVWKIDRQELAFDGDGKLRRRCGPCINKLVHGSPSRLPCSTTTGHDGHI